MADHKNAVQSPPKMRGSDKHMLLFGTPKRLNSRNMGEQEIGQPLQEQKLAQSLIQSSNLFYPNCLQK